VREIRPLGLMWRGLETDPVRYGEPRQSSTLLGDGRALQERSSETILASSLAGGIARCQSKRRQRYRWAGRLSFEKPLFQDADLLT